jgi:hypothetical protein
MQDREECGDEHEGRDGSKGQTANNDAAQRCVLRARTSRSNAMGTMPNSIARAVITTGRNRPNPASYAASTAPFLHSIAPGHG